MSHRKVGDELVVLDLDGSRYFTVRGSGILLFEMLSEPRDPQDLVDALLRRYEVDESTARHDVDVFLKDLARSGLLAT